MANETIDIDIDEDGNATIEGKNFSGADCKTLTKAIEQALGVVTNVKMKPEYHRTRTATRTTGR